MEARYFPGIVFVVLMLSLSIYSQSTVVVNDHAASESPKVYLTAAEQALMQSVILPKARSRLVSDVCKEEVELAGREQGEFTKTGATQTLIFYQFCQTGNGLGSAGVAVVEDGKVVVNLAVKDAGWTLDANTIPDLNLNGTDEIALYYSGGMHQGEGGTGVDIVDLSGGSVTGIGWYQSEAYTADSVVTGYRVTAKPGKVPAFFKEKYIAKTTGKWRKSGAVAPLKLKKINGQFETLK